MDDLTSQLTRALAAAYTIERELGGAGMSRVFLAEDHALGRKVVIKVLLPDLAAGLSAERFAREVKLAAQLQHPHIVPVLAAGDADGNPYYVMPYVEGETLRSRLSRSGALPVRDAINIIADVAKALSFAHEHGVVHRDIKPENVLLAGRSAVVSDFGVAKAISASRTQADGTLTQLGTAVGTPAYMAPEQAAADPTVDHRADIYACGVVLYEILTGRTPFGTRSTHEMIRAHFTEKPPSLREERADVPPAIAELVERCLAKDPRDRPASAEVLLATLDAVDTPRSGVAAVTAAQPAPRLRQLTGVMALAVILIGVGAFAWLRSRESTAPSSAARVLVLRPDIVGADASLSATASMVGDAIAEGLSGLDWMSVVDQPTAGREDKGDAAARARAVGAGTVITGELYAVGDSVQLQLRLADARTGQLVRSLPPLRIARNAPTQALRDAVDPVLSLTGYVTHPLLGAATIPAGHIPRFAAFTELASALSLAGPDGPDTSTYQQRFAHLHAAVRLDSGFDQGILWLGAYLASDYRSPEAVHELQALLPSLNRRDQRRSPFESALARYSLETSRSGNAALAYVREMAAIAPNSVFGASLPAQLLDINRPREALAILDRIRDNQRQNGLFNDRKAALYWGRRADILHFLGDGRAELEAAQRGLATAPSDIQQVRRELRALVTLGRFAEVERRIDEINDARSAGRVFDFAGDVYLLIGQEMIAHGDSARGSRITQRAVEWFERRTPEEMANQNVRFRAALAYFNVGDLERAMTLARRLHRERPDDVRYLGFVGRIAAKMGRRAETEAILDSLEAKSLLFAGSPTYERAAIHAVLDHKAEAVALLQESIRQGQGWGIRARVHYFGDWRLFHDYEPFRRVITPQG